MKVSVPRILRIVCAMALLLQACSGKGGSDEEPAIDKALFSSGIPVPAASFEGAARIRLYSIASDGSATLLRDGDYGKPSSMKIGVEITGGASLLDRVFVTDGGGYQVEALPENGRYVCDFIISPESLYQVILVQAIHTDGKASKEKLVLRTTPPIPDNSYVENGIGLLFNEEVLDGQKEDIAQMLDRKSTSLFSALAAPKGSPLITALSHGDGNPSTTDVVVNMLDIVESSLYPEAVLHINFTVKDVALAAMPVFGKSIVTTDHNDLTVDTFLSIENMGNEVGIRLVLDFLGTARARFAKQFFFSSVIENAISSRMTKLDLPPIAIDLEEDKGFFWKALPDDLTVNGSPVDTDAMQQNLTDEITKYLFVDARSMAESTVPGLLSLGLGTRTEEFSSIQWIRTASAPAQQIINTDGIFIDVFEKSIDDMIAEAKLTYPGLINDLSYGDNDPNTDDFQVEQNGISFTDGQNIEAKVAKIRFRVKSMDIDAANLFGQTWVHTEDNDLIVEAEFDLVHLTSGSSHTITFKPKSVLFASFVKDFFGKAGAEEMVKTELMKSQGGVLDVGPVMNGIELGVDVSQAVSSLDPYPLFPSVEPYRQAPGWETVLPPTYNLHLAFSRHNVDSFLKNLFGNGSEKDVKDLLIPILGGGFPGFGVDRSKNEATIMRLNAPPVMDLRTAQIRLLIPDVTLQYRISGVPQWEASIDLDLILTPIVRGRTLDVHITPVEGRNRFHMMRDNQGKLTMLDHSTFAFDLMKNLSKIFGKASSEAPLSFNLKEWEPGLVLKENDKSRSAPMVISSSGSGYLNIDIAAASLDLIGLTASGM